MGPTVALLSGPEVKLSALPPQFPDRRWLLVAALVVTGSCAAPDATAPVALTSAEPLLGIVAASGFNDDFASLDPARWSIREHPLGRGWFRAANVVSVPGTVQLVHPAGTLDGGEIATVEQYGYGTYEARMRTPVAPGTISAFFLYQGGEPSDEIDIEIFNDGSRRIMFTVWNAGVEKYNVIKTLPFDPSAAVHSYRIEYARGVVRFSVDGVVYQQWSSNKNIPRSAMYLMVNTWWPVWIGGDPLPSDVVLEIESVQAIPR